MLYLDSSAVVKLVARQPETPALVETLREDPQALSSALSWTEVTRAVRRAGGSARRAVSVLEGIALIPIDDGILRAAGTLAPSTLRTLDAIHLASALSVSDDLSAFVAYDVRLADAAAAMELRVLRPGA